MARNKIGGPRRHVILSKQQGEKLDTLSKATGLTQSEHMRRAIDSYFRLLDAAKKRATT